MAKPLAWALSGQMDWGLTGGLCFTSVVSLDYAAPCSTITHYYFP